MVACRFRLQSAGRVSLGSYAAYRYSFGRSPGSTGQGFGRLADGVVLVVRAGETTRDIAQAAATRLQEDGTVLLGTVLNQSH